MKKAFYLILLILPALLVAAALLFLLATSLMDRYEVVASYGPIVGGEGAVDAHLLPRYFSITQYLEILWRNPGFLASFWNSMALVLPSCLGMTLIATLGAFGFACYRFPLKEPLFFLFLMVIMLPYQVTLVPNFIALDRMGLIGTRWAVILPNIFSPFGVFFLRRHVENIPKETLEAAEIDGAGGLARFLRVVLPQCIPGIIALLVLNLIDTWNQVEPVLVLLQDVSQYPLAITLAELNISTLQEVFASCVMYLAPLLIIFLASKEYIMDGVSQSAKWGEVRHDKR